jgi:hypothetical protein
VLGLDNINAIFDTGTTLIVGDPAGIEYFFEFLSLFLSAPAQPLPGSPGLYSSTWSNLAVSCRSWI